MNDSINKAKTVLAKGNLVVFPTETAYGIAADALNKDAIEKVYEAKQRPREKGLTVIVSSLEQAEKYCKLGSTERKLIEGFMPGPLTLVAEKKDNVPNNLNEKFVFRISSSSTARMLAEDFPIVATSANISGQSTSYSVEDIDEELLKHVNAVVDKDQLEERPASTIVEVVNDEIVVHREGPISLSELQEVVTDGSEK